MSTLPGLTAGTWTLDPAHTEIGFVARHLMVTKVRGTFTEFDGAVTIGEQLEDSSLEVTVQMASVSTGTADRDTHLKSGDFFEVETYPTMTFKSTSVSADKLVGDLTIKDVTKPVTFEVEFGGVAGDPWGGTRAGFEATTTVKRKDWGLEWNAALEGGGVLVSDKIVINIDVELVKSPEPTA